MQRRHVPLTVRAAEDGPEGRVEAYGAVFDTEYVIGPMGQRERIEAGAFEDSLTKRDSIAIFYQHGHQVGQPPIGFTTEAREDDTGLRFVADLLIDESETARMVYEGLDRGAFNEWSIGFRPEETREEDGGLLTVVERADVPEISSVLVGANPDTDTVDVRSAQVQGDKLTVDLAGADAAELIAARERLDEAIADLEPEDEDDDPEPEVRYARLKDPRIRKVFLDAA